MSMHLLVKHPASIVDETLSCTAAGDIQWLCARPHTKLINSATPMVCIQKRCSPWKRHRWPPQRFHNYSNSNSEMFLSSTAIMQMSLLPRNVTGQVRWGRLKVGSGPRCKKPFCGKLRVRWNCFDEVVKVLLAKTFTSMYYLPKKHEVIVKRWTMQTLSGLTQW